MFYQSFVFGIYSLYSLYSLSVAPRNQLPSISKDPHMYIFSRDLPLELQIHVDNQSPAY